MTFRATTGFYRDSSKPVIAKGVNLIAVRDLLGHGSIVTSSRYRHATGSAVTTVAV